MPRPAPLSSYPAATLDALRSAVAALLRYQDMLPTDLYVKLDLFRGDIATANGHGPPPPATFTPHPAAKAGPPPGSGTRTRPRTRPPGHAPDTATLPERHPE